MNYYNENDPSAAAWIMELMKAGAVPDGHLDTRSIVDVQPEDLRGFDQCHFFGGILGWPLALQLSGYQNVKGLWTGSCPCQPFSAAGKRKGTSDARHLWPEMFRLVKACRPQYVLGEQVEAAVRLGWLDGVFGDLEAEGYTTGAVVLGAHSVGAPHIRQRLYWGGARRVGDPVVRTCERGTGGVLGAQAEVCGEDGTQYGNSSVGSKHAGEVVSTGLEHPTRDGRSERRPESSGRGAPVRCGEGGGVADANGIRPLDEQQPAHGRRPETVAECGSTTGGLGNSNIPRPQGHREPGERTNQLSPWQTSILIPCADGKTRRISPEPGVFPLAHGVPGRVGLLRGYGNAIVPQVAAEFITAFMESTTCSDQ